MIYLISIYLLYCYIFHKMRLIYYLTNCSRTNYSLISSSHSLTHSWIIYHPTKHTLIQNLYETYQYLLMTSSSKLFSKDIIKEIKKLHTFKYITLQKIFPKIIIWAYSTKIPLNQLTRFGTHLKQGIHNKIN